MRERIRKRRIAFAAWALSLLALTFAVGTFWFPFGYLTPNRQVFVQNAKVAVLDYPLGAEIHYGWDFLEWDAMPSTLSEAWSDFLGQSDLPSKQLLIPLGWPSMLAMLVTTLLFWHPLRIAKPGYCLRCGYNLSGNASGRCPECGAATVPAGTNDRQ